MVETVAANGTNDSFDEGILPRGAWCGTDLLDPETLDATVEIRTVDLIPVPQQVTRRRIPGKGIDHLLRGPLRGGMLRHVEMNDPPTIVTEDDKDKKNSERHGWQREEVAGR